jgi:hypothetical protein
MLTAAAVAVMIHLALPGVPNATANRYAADIAAVAETRQQALMLVTVLRHESSFDPRVERCEVTGAVGEITGYQMRSERFTPTERKRLCSSHRAAAKEAPGRLVGFLRETFTVRGALAKYAGKPEIHRRINDRMTTYDMLEREAPADEE